MLGKLPLRLYHRANYMEYLLFNLVSLILFALLSLLYLRFDTILLCKDNT
jgi:hypothetical protein